MKNDSHPLIQALKRRERPNNPDAIRPMQPDRLFHLEKGDVPAARVAPGDSIRLHLHGRVKSVHDDGSMVMHVNKVQHQTDSTEPKEA